MMNVVVIDMWMPTPDRDTASLRMVHLLSLLKKSASSVIFAADDPTSYGRPSVQQLRDEGIDVLHTQFDGPIETYIEQFGYAFDVIILSRLEVAKKYIDQAHHFAPQAAVVFDTVDLHFLRRFRRAKLTGNIGMLKAAIEAKQDELRSVNQADLTWVVSNEEQRILEQECPDSTILRLSIIQDMPQQIPPYAGRSGILFIGAFPFHPNPDAMEYYYDDILPLLAVRLPGVATTVIGSSPPRWLVERNGPAFQVKGYVPDLSPFLERCRLTIAPLRFGAGVKGKVILSMSYGVPVVASSIAAEGIPAADGQDILVADDAESFCEKIAALYEDDALWQALSHNGRRIVNDHFSTRAARQAVDRTFNTLGS
jgi:glycosyltransferase involved in cell wall biosynthesis